MQMHRRKSSKEEGEGLVSVDEDSQPPPRTRVKSTPLQPSHGLSASQSYSNLPPSAGPFRSSFSFNGSANGHVNGAPSPFHPSFPRSSHSRTKSTSGPYAPSSPSPVSPSFASQAFPSAPQISQSSSSSSEASQNGTPSARHNRRHTRLNSRNLSIFFPRPGSLPHSTIAEDGVQELVVDHSQEALPSTLQTSSSSSGRERLGEGFTFGGRPPESDDSKIVTSASHPMSAMSSKNSRRGHHHRHSLSHNFFAFLEPGGPVTPGLSTPIPVSPWNPISPFSSAMPQSAGPSSTAFPSSVSQDSVPAPIGNLDPRESDVTAASVSAVAQFLLGAWIWVCGQQVGSLSCTGLGYLVVFDAFGIALGQLLPVLLAKESMQARLRRPYGNARIETVLLFAQSVYLMFSSVYICKETVEHLLLSVGEEGHHHHFGDETANFLGIQFPSLLIIAALLSLTGSALRFNNHSKLVNIAGNYLPPIAYLIRSALSRYPAPSSHIYPLPTSRFGKLWSNPFAISPIAFALSLLIIASIVPPSQHQAFDLLLAAVQTIVMFRIAYSACVALGAVLLQTAPRRGVVGGRMEAFLRTMREIERHPKILHLPAPHIWQLTPPLTRPNLSSESRGPVQSLVVTLELHVEKDMVDQEVLELTRWAWEKCERALAVGTNGSRGEAEVEVTVGVVRG